MEYFIRANSFAAPFVSDTSTSYEVGDTVEEALQAFVDNYRHPCGLFAAAAYASADDYHKGFPAIAHWMSNAAMEHELALKTDPKAGRVVKGYPLDKAIQRI